MSDAPLVLWLSDLDRSAGDQVGGKNASLGEMIRNLEMVGIRVPDGFATTATAYRQFVEDNGIEDRIREQLGRLKDDRSNLAAIGKAIRKLFTGAEFPPAIADAITQAYEQMGLRSNRRNMDVAVRSSATAEGDRRLPGR